VHNAHDLHMVQLMPLALRLFFLVWFTFLVLAYSGCATAGEMITKQVSYMNTSTRSSLLAVWHNGRALVGVSRYTFVHHMQYSKYHASMHLTKKKSSVISSLFSLCLRGVLAANRNLISYLVSLPSPSA